MRIPNTAFHKPACRAFGASIIAIGLAGAAPVASATTVNCPGTVTTADREMSLSVIAPAIAGCVGSGTGNIEGPTGDKILALLGASSGYVLIDKSDDTTSGTMPSTALSGAVGGTTTGSLTFQAPGYQNLVVGFHFGHGAPTNAALNPDWFAYSLSNGTTTASWSILAGAGANSSPGLSHINLYGKVVPVPVPAACWLLGSALTGMIGLKRRKNA